jgi:hypothetical protein
MQAPEIDIIEAQVSSAGKSAVIRFLTMVGYWRPYR